MEYSHVETVRASPRPVWPRSLRCTSPLAPPSSAQWRRAVIATRCPLYVIFRLRNKWTVTRCCIAFMLQHAVGFLHLTSQRDATQCVALRRHSGVFPRICQTVRRSYDSPLAKCQFRFVRRRTVRDFSWISLGDAQFFLSYFV